jgi:hypothetical protein
MPRFNLLEQPDDLDHVTICLFVVIEQFGQGVTQVIGVVAFTGSDLGLVIGLRNSGVDFGAPIQVLIAIAMHPVLGFHACMLAS